MTPASDHKVLIVAPDPVLAALVGSVVELSRLRAAFPRSDERPEDALERVKPLVAILIDALADEAESDIFLARAKKKGVDVRLFGSADRINERRAWAEARNIPMHKLPEEVAMLELAIRQIAETAGKRTRSFERRGKPKIDGPIVVNDRAGKRWSIYDRRSADRRQHVVDREFVSETGEVRHCHIDEAEAARISPEALLDQLERSLLEGKE